MDVITMLYIVALTIASMAFIFLFMILRKVEVNEEKIRKILGDEIIDKLKSVSSDEEIKEILRTMPKRKRNRLKTLLESQDVRVAVDAIKKHILKK